MSIIYSYPEQGALNANDMLIGTSAEKVGGKQKNITRNFTVQQIADFINRGAGFVDPVASDFQIPVFNQEGKKITGSIMSQNIYPNGSAITITGSLTVANGATIGDFTNDIILQSPTALIGPIKDANSALSAGNQILLSTPSGNVVWQNYEAGLTYEGTWNASTNTPALVSGQGVSGHFYIVSDAGNTNLDGNNDWHIGDWAVFFDAGGAGTAAWQKIDNTSVLTGTGTDNKIAMWTGGATPSVTLTDSLISQDAGATKVIVDGLLEIKGDGTSQDGRIKLNCWNNNHGVTIQSPPHSGTLASYTLVLPTSQGSANQVLTTDGNTPSQLSWTTPTASVTGTGTQNYVTKWSAGGISIEDSTIFDNGTNVGIGTASPSSLLNIEGTKNTAILTLGSNYSGSGWSVGDKVGGINFYSADSSGAGAGVKASISYEVTAGTSGATNSLIFSTAGTSSGENNLERMRITQEGNVGIGISSPSAKLEVKESLYVAHPNSGEITFRLDNYGTTGTDAGSVLRMFNQLGNTSVSIDSRSGSTRHTYFNQGGNFGIGTTSPAEKLYVNSTSGDARIGLNAPTGSDTEIKFSNAGVVQYSIGHDDATDNFVIGTANVDTPKVSISKAGNVGIGTTSPGSLLSIRTASSSGNEDFVTFSRGTSPETEVLKISRNAGDVRFLAEQNITLSADYNNDQGNVRSNIILKTNDVEAMRIDGNGKVGIGTSSPAVSLDISATDAVQMPAGVTGDRPTGANGMLRYNSSNNGFEGFINGNWGDIGGGSSGGLIFRGTFNANTGSITGTSDFLYNPGASTNTIPIAIGDMYIVTVAGNFYGNTALNVGDEVIAIAAAAINSSSEAGWNAVASGAGGAVTGSGTTNYVPKFTGATVVGNSSIFNDAGGNVGIGTSSPSAALDIKGVPSGGSGTILNVGLDSSNPVRAKIHTETYNGAFSLYDSASIEDVKITSSGNSWFNGGNVGIGTSSPSYKLSTTTAGTAAEVVAGFGNNNIQGGLQIITSDGNLDWGINALNSRNLVFQTNQTERMRVDSNGNVGIGTTSPLVRTQISTTLSSGSVQDALLLSQNTSTSTSGQGVKMYLSSNNSISRAAAIEAIAGSSNDHSLGFYTNSAFSNPTERMLIDSAGKVGIGTSQPEVSLDLGNNIDAIRVPNGANADRPSGILPGMIRYNTSTNEFEGYSGTLGVSGSWGALGGGSLPTKTVDAFTGSGQGSISLSVEASDKNYIDMYIDGVYQSKATYSIATVGAISVLTLNSAGTFPTGVSIETVTTT